MKLVKRVVVAMASLPIGLTVAALVLILQRLSGLPAEEENSDE